MGSVVNATARRVLVILLLTASCEAEPTAEPRAEATAPAPSPAAALAAGPNRVMGTGEPRMPEPFTIEQRFLDAVRRGDRPTIERALERGANIDSKDDIGRNAVFLAVLDANDLDLVRWLAAKGAADDEPDSGGRTPLSFAAADGQPEIARYLVERGATVDRADAQQRTPLFHAALGDHSDIVSLLLDHRADANARDQFGDTPLIVACAKGNRATAALLLRRGADPDLKDQEGRTARERAAAGTDICRTPPAR